MTTVSNHRLAQAAVALAPSPAAPSDLQRQSWQQEFERARWQAQPRYQAATTSEATASPAETAAQHEAALTVGPMQGEASSFLDERSRSISTATMTDAVLAPDMPEAHQRAVVPLETHVQGHASASVIAARSRAAMSESQAAAVADPASPPRQTWNATSPWLQRVVHVHAGEHTTAVWIRDARLLPEQALQVLDTLEASRSELPDAGKPIELTLNGRPLHRGTRST